MICVQVHYTTERTVRSMSALTDQQKELCRRHGYFPSPPRKTAGRRYALQAKKSPQRATISVSVPNWWDFTPKSEPISAKAANLSRAACPPRGRTRPASRPLCLFMRFPPAEFLFLLKRGWLVGILSFSATSGLNFALNENS